VWEGGKKKEKTKCKADEKLPERKIGKVRGRIQNPAPIKAVDQRLG